LTETELTRQRKFERNSESLENNRSRKAKKAVKEEFSADPASFFACKLKTFPISPTLVLT
jgi:hypothetical protein